VTDSQGLVSVYLDILARNVNFHVLQERMATTAVRGAVVKTMQYVLEKMVLATASDQGGQGCCVIIAALWAFMGSTV